MHSKGLYFYSSSHILYLISQFTLSHISINKLLQLFLQLLSFSLQTDVISDLPTSIAFDYYKFYYIFTFISDIYTFICFTSQDCFVSSPFNNFYRASLLVMNFSSFCLSGKFFYFCFDSEGQFSWVEYSWLARIFSQSTLNIA